MNRERPSCPPAPEDEHLPGLAGERTDLAWSRSGLALAAMVAVVLRRVFEELDEITAPAVVFGLLVGGAVAWALALLHARVVVSDTLTGRRLADPRALRLVALGTTALALGALLLALAPRPR